MVRTIGCGHEVRDRLQHGLLRHRPGSADGVRPARGSLRVRVVNGVSFDGEFFSFTGRDPGALEYTRWGSIDMTSDDGAVYAANGTTRLAVPLASADAAAQREEISAFADRLGLR